MRSAAKGGAATSAASVFLRAGSLLFRVAVSDILRSNASFCEILIKNRLFVGCLGVRCCVWRRVNIS